MMAGTAKAVDDVYTVLNHLDDVARQHAEWLKAVNRSLICHLPVHTVKQAEIQHERLCTMGSVSRQKMPATLKSHPAIHALCALHKDIHKLARQLLGRAQKGAAIEVSDYDNFMNQVLEFGHMIRQLQFEIRDRLSAIDPLTGVFNRFGMTERLLQEKERVTRAHHPCAISMMDLDYFKSVNDTHGHRIGDAVLRAAAQHCLNRLRKYDMVYRYGGEEFLLCLPFADEQRAHGVLERVRQSLNKLAIETGNGQAINISASFGITTMTPEDHLQDIIERADKALLHAKSQGRNRVHIWHDNLH